MNKYKIVYKNVINTSKEKKKGNFLNAQKKENT